VDGYRRWARGGAAPGLTFVPVELPGHGARRLEPLLTTMEAVTDVLLTLLASRPSDEPFVLLGHSMGGNVGYQTACRLAAAGRPLPLLVVASASRPPGAPDRPRLPLDCDEALLEHLRRLGGTPAEVLADRRLVELLLPPLRTDLTLLEEYNRDVAPTPLPCPLLALGGADDLLTPPAALAGWAALTTAWFGSRVLPGGHFFLYQQHAAVVAELSRLLPRLIRGFEPLPV
jgi:surfactin synthase thioesterase subunit